MTRRFLVTSRILRDSLKSQNGATAVEYGLIAGLIAVGIVSGLVSTKSSLSADYNCIATSVGSAGGTPCGGSAAPAASLGQQLWAGKTLSNKQTLPSGRTKNADGSYSGGQVETRYTYTDGSYVSFTNLYDANNNVTGTYLALKNPANDPVNYYNWRVDGSGNQTYFEIDKYAAGSNYGTLTGYSYQYATGTTQYNGTCNNGSCGGSGSSAPTTAFQSAAQAMAGQIDYFRQLTAGTAAPAPSNAM